MESQDFNYSVAVMRVRGGLGKNSNEILLSLADRVALREDSREILTSISPSSNKVLYCFPNRSTVREVLL